MDAITQVQSYVKSMGALFATTLEHVHRRAPPVGVTEEGAHVGLDEADLEERAKAVFRLFHEADLLMASLPTRMADEREQLEAIAALQKKNAEAGERLERARERAAECQARVSAALREVSRAQFDSTSSLPPAPPPE